MASRKSLLIFFGIFMLSIWVFGSVIQAEAETMKCKASGNVVKREVMPIPDVEGHSYNMLTRDGLAFLKMGKLQPLRVLAFQT